MTKNQLNEAINSILDNGNELSTVVYAVMKETYEVKQLNIVNDEIEYIQNMFIQSIKNTLIEDEEQVLLNVSTADDRGNAIFLYDLDLPEGLNFLNTDLNDRLPAFSFNNDELTDIDSLIIEIGTEENQLKLYKKLSPVEIFGRGGYMLWKSNNQLERFEDKILRFTPKFHAIIIDGETVFTDLKLLETSHGFHDVIVREANLSVQLIADLDILDETDGITEMLSSVTFARKVLKIRNSPVIINNIPNATIIAFTKSHPALINKMRYSEDDTKIILRTKKSKELFIKMLDDAYLTSELTNQFYESKAKDAVELEIVDEN